MRRILGFESRLASNNNNKNKNKNKINRSSSLNGGMVVAKSQKIGGNGVYSLADLKKSLNSVVREGLKGAGAAGGAYLGGQLGMSRTGSRMGSGIGARISKLIGTGDYATSVDVAMNSLVKPGATQYASFGDSKTSVRLCHREYLQDAFTGPTANVFHSTAFQINPGLSNTFPFLSQIAGNFEEYKIHGLVFEYVSTTSPYNSTSAMGSVIMAMEYNANSPPFTSKPQMENSDFAISARPDKSMIYGVECVDNATNHLFVRGGPGNLPLTTTDIGLFQFATLTPLAVNTTLGEIWVSYDIELFRPKISPFKPGYYHLAATVGAIASGTITTGDYTVVRPPGVAPVAPVATGNLSTVALSASLTTLTLNDVDVGDVISATFSISAASAIQQTLSIFTSSGLTPLLINQNYTSQFTTNGSTTGAVMVAYYRVDTNIVPQTLTANISQTLTSGGNFDFVLQTIGNGQTLTNL